MFGEQFKLDEFLKLVSSSKSPVTIIGGYLGSGKTTLINHTLLHCGDTTVAVLVNDFGDLPIDANLYSSTKRQHHISHRGMRLL